MRKIILLFLLGVLFSTSSFAFISQGNWRWRNNNGSETTATWKAPENIAVTINSIDSIIRLRIQLQNNTGDTKNFNANLQFASAPDGPWRYVTNYTGNNPFKITTTTQSNTLFLTRAQKTSHPI